MGIAFNLLTQQQPRLKELKWLQRYTRKVEEKFRSSTFPHGMKLNYYSKQLKQIVQNWSSPFIFQTLQQNPIFLL